MNATTVFQDMQDYIWQLRDDIVDSAIIAYNEGGDFESIIETQCKLFNIEAYIVREHFAECIRFLSLKTVTVTK